MAEDKSSSKSDPKNDRGKHPFLRGWIIGMLIGILLGWWFRPPSSFPIEDLKRATEKKFTKAKKQGRAELMTTLLEASFKQWALLVKNSVVGEY